MRTVPFLKVYKQTMLAASYIKSLSVLTVKIKLQKNMYPKYSSRKACNFLQNMCVVNYHVSPVIRRSQCKSSFMLSKTVVSTCWASFTPGDMVTFCCIRCNCPCNRVILSSSNLWHHQTVEVRQKLYNVIFICPISQKIRVKLTLIKVAVYVEVCGDQTNQCSITGL